MNLSSSELEAQINIAHYTDLQQRNTHGVIWTVQYLFCLVWTSRQGMISLEIKAAKHKIIIHIGQTPVQYQILECHNIKYIAK